MSARIRRLAAAAGITATVLAAAPAPAFIYWKYPQIQGAPVTGLEPEIALQLPGAKPEEVRANLLWSMRAGLNVAALQCQFAPGLMAVRYYNDILRTHTIELQGAFNALSAYFKRTGGKTWQTKLDEYTTRTYNGFSTFHAQYSFCETAGSIDREAMSRPKGKLIETAIGRMREFRNSQVPIGDAPFTVSYGAVPTVEMPVLDPICSDAKGRRIDCLTGKKYKPKPI